MKVLITGAAGMLGSSLVPIFSREYEVYPTDIDASDAGIDYLDVRDANQVFSYVTQVKPKIIVHLAAETDVDRCEKEPKHAFLSNTIGTHNVALACQETDALLVYISTAQVFDGSKEGAYTEFDCPNPPTIYGQSKLQGEYIIEKLLNKYFTVRAGWMIGGGDKDKKFVAKVMRQINSGEKKIFAVTDKYGSITYAPELSQGLLDLIPTKYYGTYHLACRGVASRYDIAKHMLKLLGRSDIELVPVLSDYFIDDFSAPRNPSEVLRNYMLELRGLDSMRSWQDALAEYLDQSFKTQKNSG